MKQKIIFSLLLFATLTTAWSQCSNNVQNPANSVPIPVVSGSSQTIATNQLPGQYASLSGAVAGSQLRFATSIGGDFLTVRSGLPNGPVLGFGTMPLVINNTFNGTIFLHLNTNSSCGTGTFGRITAVETISSPPAPSTHLNFDGVDDYVNCGVNAAYDFTTGTVEAWIKPNSFSDNKAIISLRTDTGNARWSLHVNEANNTLGIFNGFGFNTIAANIDPNQWYHVAYVMNTTQTEVYLNGVSVGIINLGINTASTGNQLLIGYPELVSWASERFSGSIEDVRIWNVARTATQISASKNCELQGTEAGLVSYYKFNQGFDASNNTAITSANATTGSNGTLNNFALTGATSNWLAGSPVTTGSTIPNAPTGLTYVTPCFGATASTLRPVISSTIKWYASATATTALVTTDVLTTGAYYAAAVNANGCESTRTPLSITVNTTPIVANFTLINSTCGLNNGSASVAPTGGGGTPYSILWATGQIGNTINNLLPGNYSYLITDSNGCNTPWINFTISNILPTAPTAISPQVFVGGTNIGSLTATGSNLKWYLTATGGTALLNITTLVDGTTYYVSQTNACGGESARTAVTVRKISEATQTLCSPAIVASLVTTPTAGTTAKWFTAASGGTALADNTTLTSGTYYIEQNTPTTTVTLGSGFYQPAGVAIQSDGKIVVADIGNNAIKRMNADGSGIVILGSGFSFPSGVAIQTDGKIVVADRLNNAVKRMNADGSGIVTLGSGFRPSGVAIQSDGKVVVADTGNNAIKRMNADGSGIVTLGSGFSLPTGVAIQSDGKIVVADYNNNAIKRMNADGSGIVTLGSGFIVPFGVAIQSDGKIVVADTGYNAVKRMNADGSGIVTLDSGFSIPNGVAIQSDGKIVVADRGNNAIKRITEASNSNRVAVNVVVTTLSNATTQNLGILTATENALGVTYQWYQCPNTLLSGETNQNFTPTATGDYKVEVTKGTCLVSSVCETVLGNSNFESNSGLSIYPNPSKGIFNISILEDANITVNDMLGKVIYTNKVKSGNNTIDISSYQSGLYLLNIANENGSVTKKIIKE